MNGPKVLPGSDPFRFVGGPMGLVMIHGFTGSPASMRPIGEWLAAQGLSVLGIRLPGHGTSPEDLAVTPWTDWVAEADAGLSDLRGRCERVVLFAQSMGGAVALLLASRRPADVAGLALVNPYVHDRRLLLLPVGRLFVSSVKGVGSDIRKPGAKEDTYDRIPVRAISQLRGLLMAADGELPLVTAPLLLFRSQLDHVIPRGNVRRVLDRVGSTRRELVACPNSFHVVTLDHDAPMVQERVLDFVKTI